MTTLSTEEWLARNRERRSTAYHEAGHAVAATLLGAPFRYVTLAPRHPGHAGHLVGRPRRAGPARNWHLSPWWLTKATVSSAGMAASACWFVARFGALRDSRRACITQEGATGSLPGYDLPTLRWIARTVYEVAANGGPVDHGPEFAPEWSASPDGVRLIAGHAWRRAVELMAENFGAVRVVAEALHTSRRALTAAEVAGLVTNSPPVRVDVAAVGVDFWPARYSRLVWRPQGQCRGSR